MKNLEVLEKEKELTQRQSQAIILLLQGKTIEEIAKTLGVAVNSVYRWLETDPLFKKEYSEAKERVFREALESLRVASKEAVQALRDLLLTGHKDTARLGSAKSILELAIKTKELGELEKRLEALEQKLEV